MKVLAGRYFGQKGIVALIEGLPVGLLAKRTKKVVARKIINLSSAIFSILSPLALFLLQGFPQSRHQGENHHLKKKQHFLASKDN